MESIYRDPISLRPLQNWDIGHRILIPSGKSKTNKIAQSMNSLWRTVYTKAPQARQRKGWSDKEMKVEKNIDQGIGRRPNEVVTENPL